MTTSNHDLLEAMGYNVAIINEALSQTDGSVIAAVEWIESQPVDAAVEPRLQATASELLPPTYQSIVPRPVERISVPPLREMILPHLPATSDKKILAAELERWGPPNNDVRQIIMRYWVSTHMVKHWLSLRSSKPRDYLTYLEKGYCEPISSITIASRNLTRRPLLLPSMTYENPSEERLYYVLNNMEHAWHGKPMKLKPISFRYSRSQYLKRGELRGATAVPFDESVLARYSSPIDTFKLIQTKNQEYSKQVPRLGHSNRTAALMELADHGDQLETMVMVDFSDSMTADPRLGVIGKDGIKRFHDQPTNLMLVKNLLHRLLNHMTPRTQRLYPDRDGVPIIAFGGKAEYCGNISAKRFDADWRTKVACNTYASRRNEMDRSGWSPRKVPNQNATTNQIIEESRVMTGWQVVKSIFFEQMKLKGHGVFDTKFGWQATPGMPKLSLLVFLNGEAEDMDEFELELLGETWAYVTIVLVGYENCPNHHSHASELERIAEFNPHVGFYDVQGRVLERFLVEEVLNSVYPIDPPIYEEITAPEYELVQSGRE
ncbi:UNVERIFIED_CONTAM: hypothetical protein HDU68_001855 [Siphonaria sp. JEL0065]|nr:hypothetical protein HDU68_001855 [Siphonaria sp. JEL0065]